LQKLILRGKKPSYSMDRGQLAWLYRSDFGTVSHIDREVGLILDSLKELGLADNTIAVRWGFAVAQENNPSSRTVTLSSPWWDSR
jgi:hypothetical protein